MNERAQVVSGWDFEKSSPKPTRRLMPVGSVFFLKLQGDKVSIGEWVDALWMQTISDQDVDRRDGFGLAVLGTWSGHCPTLEI